MRCRYLTDERLKRHRRFVRSLMLTDDKLDKAIELFRQYGRMCTALSGGRDDETVPRDSAETIAAYLAMQAAPETQKLHTFLATLTNEELEALQAMLYVGMGAYEVDSAEGFDEAQQDMPVSDGNREQTIKDLLEKWNGADYLIKAREALLECN